MGATILGGAETVGGVESKGYGTENYSDALEGTGYFEELVESVRKGGLVLCFFYEGCHVLDKIAVLHQDLGYKTAILSAYVIVSVVTNLLHFRASQVNISRIH